MLKQPCYTQIYASGRRTTPIFHAVFHHSYLPHDSQKKQQQQQQKHLLV